MDFLQHLYHTLRHLNPDTVSDFAHYVGPWLYVVLFAIVFCETGLVVTPFLPGDSLLFTIGAVAAIPNSGVNLWVVMLLLCLAANLGDVLNYTLGYNVGPRVFSRESSWLLNRKHLDEAQRFYDKHGRATIILARFVPVIRTFAPFVAGIGKMPFTRFIGFSIAGGALWVTLITVAGYFLGRIPFFQRHFELVVVAIVVISVLPPIFHWMQTRRESKQMVGAPTDA